MYLRSRGIYALLFWAALTICAACHGQNVAGGKSKLTKANAKASRLAKEAAALDKGISVIFQDSKGIYWLAGKEGVYKWAAALESEAEKSWLLYGLKDGLCSTSILNIQEDHLGNIYFDAQGCVSKFDGLHFTTLEIVDGKRAKNEWKMGPNDLWFRLGWDKNGPYRYDGNKLYFLEFPKPQQADEFYEKYPNASYTPYGIYSQYRDSKGSVWFGTASLGLCRYDGKSISWLYEKQLTKTPSGGDFGIRSIIEDRTGDFWFCNSRYRFQLLPDVVEEKGASYLQYTKTKGVGEPSDPENDFPYFMSVAEDDAGDLWMLTNGAGVWRNDGKQLMLYPIKKDQEEVMFGSIYKDKQGVLWLTTRGAGVYKYNGTAFEEFKWSL